MASPSPSTLMRTTGYEISYLLRRESENEVEFITIILWDSIEQIRAVSGEFAIPAWPTLTI
jgi:hypothetical protein